MEVGTGSNEPRVNIPDGSLTYDTTVVDPINVFVIQWLACENKGALFGFAGYSDRGLLDSYFATSIQKWDDMVARVSASDYSQPPLSLLGLYGWTNLDDGRFGVYHYGGIGFSSGMPTVEFIVMSGTLDELKVDKIYSYGEVKQAQDF